MKNELTSPTTIEVLYMLLTNLGQLLLPSDVLVDNFWLALDSEGSLQCGCCRIIYVINFE